MKKREEAIAFCLKYPGAYEDYPFDDKNWCVIRHRENKKVFVWIFNKDGFVYINLKCDPNWTYFYRSSYKSVIPAYHLNKEHWNSVILDGTVPEKEIENMVQESYNLTAKKLRRKSNSK